MTDPYLPSEDVVSKRNSRNKARAAGDPYRVPDEFLTAETLNLRFKFEQRRSLDGLFRCYLCGEPFLSDDDWHLDHVFPLALGGTHTDDNLEAACKGCNLFKGASRLEDLLDAEELTELRKAEGVLGTWPPPFVRLSAKPVDELWSYSKKAARRFARTPRKNVSVRRAPWGATTGKDFVIARYLASQPDPWRAVSIANLWQPIGYKRLSSLEQQWKIALGLGGSPSRDWEDDVRNPTSPYIVATRTHPQHSVTGDTAFRLRFDANPLVLVGQVGQQPDFIGDELR